MQRRLFAAGILRRRSTAKLTGALLLGILAACDSPTEPGFQPVANLRISPDGLALLGGEVRQLEATTLSASGAFLPGRHIEWSSSDTMIVHVTRLGVVTARASGSARVTASSEGSSSSTIILVAALPRRGAE